MGVGPSFPAGEAMTACTVAGLRYEGLDACREAQR